MYGVRDDKERSEGKKVHHIKIEVPANGKYQQGDLPIMLNIERKKTMHTKLPFHGSYI